MKRLFFFFMLFALICLQNARAQELSLETSIQKADHLWAKNKLGKAIEQYRIILEKENIPKEYQALFYLRLAGAQFQAKQTEDCRKTLAKAKTLVVLPAHDQLKIEELEQNLDGVSYSERTPIPVEEKAVASFQVSLEKSKTSTGINYPSINQALVAANLLKQNSSLPEGPIEIIVEGDSYQLDETIQLNSGNSGTKKNPIVIRSATPGKKVVINGGQSLKYWKKETNPDVLNRLPEISRSKVWVADLKENNATGIDSLIFGGFSSKRAKGGNASFKTFPVPELFVGGIAQKMARWPNDRDTTVALKDFKDRRIFKWAKDQDVWLHGYWFYLWADAYEKMSGVSQKDSILEIAPPVNGYGFGKSKWHVVNVLSELDMPGEWCISATEQKIWYFPLTDSKPDQVILSLTGPAFEAADCNFLTVKDLNFRYIRGDGMLFTNCSHLSLINCSVANSSGLGIKISGGNDHLLHSCNIESMGRGGIDISAGDKQKLIPSGSIIENCKISNLSRIDRTYTPAILLEGVGIKVRHCLFANIPSSAIRLEGNDMLIEKNEFTKCVIESDDQGAIDVWGNPLYRGNVIRWNFFHDIGIPNLHMAAGIRLDDAICGFSISENLFLRASNNQFGGIQIHGGKDNFIEGNVFADCHAAISQSAWGDKRWVESLNSPDHPAYKAMHSCDWQGKFWLSRYPALKNLLTDSDRNYATDNLAINAKTLILRKSERFQIMNNHLLKKKRQPKAAIDFKKYTESWHLIPVDKIGSY